MLVAIADTPEELRAEILKLIKWREERENTESGLARNQRDKTKYAYTGRQLKSLQEEVERVTVVGKDELKISRVEPTAPTINLNGSDPKRMIEDILDTGVALREVEQLLRDIRPHGRDYQTAPAGNFEKALAEHEERIKWVGTILKDLEKIALAIQDQQRR